MLFKVQWHIEKALLDLSLGPGFSWMSPPNEIKILHNHVAIHTFNATVVKDDTTKNLVHFILFQ